MPRSSKLTPPDIVFIFFQILSRLSLRKFQLVVWPRFCQPSETKSNRALKTLWRDLILKTWGDDPLRCPCCSGTMKNAGMILRRAEIEFFLRLFGLWEGVIALPPPPDPPFNIETMEPIDIPPNRSWTDQIGPPPQEWWTEGDTAWHAPELPLDDGHTLVLDADNSVIYDEFPVFLID